MTLSKTIVLSSLMVILLAGLVYRSAQDHNIPLVQIDNPNDYPWCTWTGEVKNGKPHGFGSGECLFGWESAAKQGLAPPLSKVQQRFIERQDKAISTGKSLDAQKCDASHISCECVSYHELLVRGRIDNYTTFIGNYAYGNREGEGIFFYSDGTTYRGQWRDDKRHGEGALLNASCEVIYEGQWCANRQGRCPSA